MESSEAQRSKLDEPRFESQFLVRFCKGNVVVHPSKSEAIIGYLYILENSIDGKHFLAWTPSTMHAEEKKNDLEPTYSVKIPLEEIRSIRRVIPTLGIPYLVIITASGIAFPPYYFKQGGVREFFNSLKDHVHLFRNDEDPNLFIVSNSSEPLFDLRTSMGEVKMAEIPPSDPVWKKPTQAENISWNILENFSKVTKFAREVSRVPVKLFDELDQLNKAKRKEEEKEDLQKAHSTSLGTFEMVEEDEVLPTLKVQRMRELGAEEWVSYFDKDGRINDEAGVRKRIFYGGVDPCIRIEVWKYLLKFYPFNSTYLERETILSERREKYAKWKSMWKFIDGDKECKFGRLKSRAHTVEKDVHRTDRKIEFYAGEGNPNLVKLNDILVTYSFFNFDLGYAQGMNELLSPILALMGDETVSFWCFKGLMDEMEPNFHKDQNGMHTQLVELANLVKVIDSGLYEYLEEKECINMFFCFRWILIHFKREFSFTTIQRLWEVLWSHHFPKFHLFIALAILLKNRKQIINQKMEFDDIVQFLNDMSGKLNLERLLIEAEELYNQFSQIADNGVLSKFHNKKIEGNHASNEVD